jgi:hypothetical protein
MVREPTMTKLEEVLHISKSDTDGHRGGDAARSDAAEQLRGLR